MAAAKPKRKRKSPTKGGATTPKRKRKAKAKAAATKTKRPPVKPQRRPAGARAGKERKTARPKASRKPAKPVKPAPPKSRAKPPRKPRRISAKAKAPAKRKPTAHERELAARRRRDRKRRAERKAEQKLGRKRGKWKRQRREKSKESARPGVAWLRRILSHCRDVFDCELETTYPGGGIAPGGGDVEISEQTARTPWLVVGKYIPAEAIGYAELADACTRVMDDLLLEADIGPQRFTQLRVLFHDPKAKRGEGDAVLSKVGAWEFVWSDFVGELVGGGDADSPDEDSLAGRYQETSVPVFYVFLSEAEIRYKTAWPTRGKTTELKL